MKIDWRKRNQVYWVPGEAICDEVLLPREVLDVGGKLGDETEIALLSGGDWSRGSEHGRAQRFVVCEDLEVPSVEEIPEVTYS